MPIAKVEFMNVPSSLFVIILIANGELSHSGCSPGHLHRATQITGLFDYYKSLQAGYSEERRKASIVSAQGRSVVFDKYQACFIETILAQIVTILLLCTLLILNCLA